MKNQPAISTPSVRWCLSRTIPATDLRRLLSIVRQRIVILLLLLGAGLILVQPCAGQSGTWTPTASLITDRYLHSATLLPNGKVLVAAGLDEDAFCLSNAELYEPMSGTWTATGGGLGCVHPATLLPNGKVLVEGGYDRDSGQAFAIASLYDPASGAWTTTGSMGTGRASHAATLLLNGNVLVEGGFDSNLFTLASAELYDPVTGTWTGTGSLITGRFRHTATLLSSGEVLVAGGIGDASAELYDPASKTWAVTGSLSTARDYTTATLLPNGKVLVAGGYDRATGVALASAELYDPASGSWSATGSLATAHYLHTATLLPNGKLLVVGGVDGSFNTSASAELYDSASGTWSATGSLNSARASHTATLLPDGKVLAAGGGDPDLGSAEIYTSDAGGRLTVVSAASRKKHGNAGTFDINLPLTGTPGVECRQGSGGTFRQTIVFTFSEPVTSISGTTTTTCGRVNSTTIIGSTVTVELGHVSCDGADITLVVPGVIGASGSVDASATMTLRTGDVNADGVVNRTDLEEIKMEVGRGLVNDHNFRDDITVDGKVNHGDTILEKSKF